MIIDTFKTQTFDGVPVELDAAIGQNKAKVVVPGLYFRYRLSVTLPKDEAFRLYHKAFILTHEELLKEADFN